MRLEELPAVAGVSHRDVHVNGVRLHLAEAGQGPPLLLLHGWPQHWWCWRHLMPQLAERYHVLAPDLRGWGWSEAPPGDYAKSTFAQDVLALLDLEGLDKVRILAHDWGAYTAFLLALDHPQRVERMVVLDIPPPWRDASPKPSRAVLELLTYQALLATPYLGARTMTMGNRFIRTIIRAGSGASATWSNRDLDCYAEVLREPERARASSSCYRTFLTRELPASFREPRAPTDLTVPTLLMMGAESVLQRAVPPQPAPSLEIAPIEGAGHFLPEEAPDSVLEFAMPFLDR